MYIWLPIVYIFYKMAHYESQYKRTEGLNYKKERRIIIFYNALIVVYVVVTEMNICDKTGMGIFLIPGFLVPLTVLHCGAILYSFLKGHKDKFKTCLMTMLDVIGVNIGMLFVDMGMIALMMSLLYKFGLFHYAR